jgi:hypothetical protein
MARSLTKMGFAVGGAIRSLAETDASTQADNSLLTMIGDFFRQSAGRIALATSTILKEAQRNNRATL